MLLYLTKGLLVMNRRTSFFVVILALVVLVVGIAPVTAQEESILIWGFADHSRGILALGEQFEEEFGIAVEYQELPFDQIPNEVINFAPVGEGPDVFLTFTVTQLVDNGVIEPIDLTGMEDQFQSASLELFNYQGQNWAVPFAYENVAFVRNVDLVPEAPTTWDEVREISAQIIESGAARYGYVPFFGDPYHQYPLWSAFGTYMFGQNEDGSVNLDDIGLNSEGGLAAAQWLSDFYGDGLADVDMGDEVIMGLFEEGEIAMLITGPWWSQRLIDSEINYSIDRLPGVEGITENGSAMMSGYGLAINSFSENKLLAEAFVLDFMMRPENMRTLLTAETGSALTRFPAFLGVEIEGDPNIAGYMAAADTAIISPNVPEFGALYNAWANATILIAQGEDPTETMNNAAEQVRTEIEASS
jgi:arabinogalactan oligomer / maltooligosaccharide transport system substrate-binding protein